MSEPIVDIFEVVEIDQEQRAGKPVTRGPLHFLDRFLLEVPPIEQTGEKIVVDQIFEASLVGFPCGDILDV